MRDDVACVSHFFYAFFNILRVSLNYCVEFLAHVSDDEVINSVHISINRWRRGVFRIIYIDYIIDHQKLFSSSRW